MKLGDVLDRSGVDTLGVLDREIDVPILSGPQPQRQGDVTVLCRPHRTRRPRRFPKQVLWWSGA